MDNLDEVFNSEGLEDLNDIDFGEDTQADLKVENEGDSDFFNSDDDDYSPAQSGSVMDKFLQSKGFVDSKVKIIDENDEEVEVNFSDLSEEEQLDILNSFSTSNNNPALNLLEDEQALVAELRNNNLTMNQFLELYKQSIIEEAGIQPEVSYDIDQYDDKELFLLDLKNKYDLSDEELQVELEKELQNEELFNKKISKVREEYKELEEQYKASQQAEFESQQQQQYQDFVYQMTDIAEKVSDFHGLELEDVEKNDTLSYLLELDENGTSQFYKDLNSPEKLYEVAWYLKYGKDAFKVIEDAYEAELAKLKTKADKPRVVRQVNNENNFKTIDDIF